MILALLICGCFIVTTLIVSSFIAIKTTSKPTATATASAASASAAATATASATASAATASAAAAAAVAAAGGGSGIDSGVVRFSLLCSIADALKVPSVSMVGCTGSTASTSMSSELMSSVSAPVTC